LNGGINVNRSICMENGDEPGIDPFVVLIWFTPCLLQGLKESNV